MKDSFWCRGDPIVTDRFEPQSSPGILIVLSAPSGAGKTTLCQRLLKEFQNLTLSISSTTRSPRGQEKNGVEYFFLTPAEFEKGIHQGDFVEWAKVHDHYYGTSAAQIQATLAKGRSVLLDIDVQGAAQLRKRFSEKCFSIFIAPPDLHELEKRLRERKTESEQAIQKRLANARGEMAQSTLFDAVIVNDDLDRAYEQLKKIIQDQLQNPVEG